MTKYQKFCNLCGKEFDIFDNQESFGIHTGKIGYGSKHDGDSIELDLCCDCFDKLIDDLIPKCKINPLTENDLITI